MVTSINAFRDMLRNRQDKIMAQKLDTVSILQDRKQGAYILNKPLPEGRDYHQTLLQDGRVIVFVGRSWTRTLVDKFIDLYNQRVISPSSGRRLAGIIPTWRRNAEGWLNDKGLAHAVINKRPNVIVSELLPPPHRIPEDGSVGYNIAGYENIMRGWYVIRILFQDKEEMEQHIPTICVPTRCWLYDKNELTILYACFYENNHVPVRYAQEQHINKLGSMTGPLNSCLWTNDEKACETWYKQYTGYMTYCSGQEYYEWGTSPQEGMSTFQFLKDLVCLPPDKGPIEVTAALDLLLRREDNW